MMDERAHEHNDVGQHEPWCPACRIEMLEQRVRELEELMTYFAKGFVSTGLFPPDSLDEVDRMRRKADERWSTPNM